MNCMVCGESMGPPQRVNLPYRSLPGVLLVGIEAQTCAACGEIEYAIPGIEALNKRIVQLLVRKATRLAGSEIKFLRKFLGWSSKDTASRLGMQPETVSRWEAGTQLIGETPDKLLRMFVIHGQPVESYDLEQFDEVAKNEGEPIHLELAADQGWAPVAA